MKILHKVILVEAQWIGRLDQEAVHPGEQDKAEEERQAGVPARRRQRSNAKHGGRCARDAYPLSLLKAQWIGRLDQEAVHPGEQDKAEEERQAGVPGSHRKLGLTYLHEVWSPP